MNIFEGSRRIAYLLGGVAAAATLVYAVTYEPYNHVTYSISHPRAAFVKLSGTCPPGAGRAYFSKPYKPGHSVSVTVCLLTTAFGEDKRQLVPYKVDEANVVWGAESYSSEVSAYESEVETRFALPPEDVSSVEREESRLYWANWKESLRNLAIGLAVFTGIVWAIGWIVRGFAGIPPGMDSRPKKGL